MKPFSCEHKAQPFGFATRFTFFSGVELRLHEGSCRHLQWLYRRVAGSVGNLKRLHGNFVYGGDPSTATRDVYAHADRRTGTISLYADFFNPLALGSVASIHGRIHYPGSFIYISDAQVQAALILHEMGRMINIGEESVHRDQKTSDQWTDEIINNCFPLKK
jgi:hypothetical protein